MNGKQLTRLFMMMCFIAVMLVPCVPGKEFSIAAQQAAAEERFSVSVSSADVWREEQNNATPFFRVEIIHDENEPVLSGKKVLIYHTHTYEAYEQNPEDPYVQTENWRTKDMEHNVVAVGKALASSLRAFGIIVEHDVSAFEPPTLESAYDRSLIMLEKRLAKGENYDLIIDIHRDAVAASSTIKRVVDIGGVKVARFMVLIGKGTTGGYDIKPDWQANYQLAQSITENMNRQYDSLARDVKIKTGRFNQHVAKNCVLIECGMNTNTLDEVIAGIPYLAEAIAETLIESETR